MKKIKFVGVAAAALLAVAPVISSSVAHADSVSVTVTGGSKAPATTADQKLNLELSVNNINSIANNSDASSLSVSLSSNFGTPKAENVSIYKASDIKDGKLAGTASSVTKLEEGQSYVAVATGVTLDGLTKKGQYTYNGKEITADTYGNITSSLTVISSKFTTPNKSLTGTPYFIEKSNKTATYNGNVTLANAEADSVNGIVQAIKAKYAVAIDGTATADWANLEKDVENSLKDANISTDSKGNFTSENNFVVTVNAAATNTKTASMNIEVKPFQKAANYSANPVISYAGQTFNHSQKIELGDKASFNYVALNSNVDTAAIQNAFSAKVSSDSNNILPVSVDISKVNTAVAGQYPVTVSATNANGKKTALTFELTVGKKGAKYQKLANDAAVYSINGNSVKNNGVSVRKGQEIATFGTTKVKGVSYTKINSKNANQYVKTSAFSAKSKKPAKAKTVKKTIMHNAAAYTKAGKRTRRVYKRLRNVNVDAKTVTIKGRKYYKISGKNEYILVDNIDGTVRTLKKNAYIYKTSTRRVNKKLLKKGTKVRTYGGSYRFRNHKTYYRIAKSSQFIRVANF